MPDADLGEVGLALVVVRHGASIHAAQIIAGLTSTLARFKIPKCCRVVAELPLATAWARYRVCESSMAVLRQMSDVCRLSDGSQDFTIRAIRNSV